MLLYHDCDNGHKLLCTVFAPGLVAGCSVNVQFNVCAQVEEEKKKLETGHSFKASTMPLSTLKGRSETGLENEVAAANGHMGSGIPKPPGISAA